MAEVISEAAMEDILQWVPLLVWTLVLAVPLFFVLKRGQIPLVVVARHTAHCRRDGASLDRGVFKMASRTDSGCATLLI